DQVAGSLSSLPLNTPRDGASSASLGFLELSSMPMQLVSLPYESISKKKLSCLKKKKPNTAQKKNDLVFCGDFFGGGRLVLL
ncbi:hypothetical protein Q8G71_36545, partial [Klebsiella pneumoniae]